MATQIGDTQIYSWQDTGAPTNTATLGNLITLLTAILVTGYNSKNPSNITRAGALVSVTSTAHGRNTGDWILSTLAPDTLCNGYHKITVISADQYTYTLDGSPSGGSADTSGVAVHIKAPAGWAAPYTASANKQAYRSPVIQKFIQIDDSLSNSYSGAYNYESMTSATVGLAAQSIQYVYRNSLGSGQVTPWYAIVKDGGKMVHLFQSQTESVGMAFGSVQWSYSYFGEFTSYAPADTFNLIFAGSGSSPNSTALQAWAHGSQSSFRVLRNWDNQVSVTPNMHYDVDWQACGITASSQQLGNGVRTYPDRVSGGVDVRPAFLWEDNYSRRGMIQGLYFPTQSLRVAEGNNKLFNCVSGTLAGKKLQLMSLYNNTTQCVLIDVT